jgi:hypothetical protein
MIGLVTVGRLVRSIDLAFEAEGTLQEW